MIQGTWSIMQPPPHAVPPSNVNVFSAFEKAMKLHELRGSGGAISTAMIGDAIKETVSAAAESLGGFGYTQADRDRAQADRDQAQADRLIANARHINFLIRRSNACCQTRNAVLTPLQCEVEGGPVPVGALPAMIGDNAPNNVFPVTAGDLDDCTAADVDSLQVFYGIVWPGASIAERISKVKLYIGV